MGCVAFTRAKDLFLKTMDWRLRTGSVLDEILRRPVSRAGSNGKPGTFMPRSAEKPDFSFSMSPVGKKFDPMVGISTMEDQPSVRPDSLRRPAVKPAKILPWQTQEQTPSRTREVITIPADPVKLEGSFYEPRSFERGGYLDLLATSNIRGNSWGYDPLQQSILRPFHEHYSNLERASQGLRSMSRKTPKKSVKKAGKQGKSKAIEQKHISSFDLESIKDFEGSMRSGTPSVSLSRKKGSAKKIGLMKNIQNKLANGGNGLKFVFRPNAGQGDEGPDDNMLPFGLGKRRVGRPKGSSTKKKSSEKVNSPVKHLAGVSTAINTSLGSNDYNNFESDGEFQELNLDESELTFTSCNCAFSSKSQLVKLSPQQSNQLKASSHCLNLRKVIDSVQKARANDPQNNYVCKYCARVFKKASSLGGHTAKMHQGMSIKYKNRLCAARGRGPERNRVKYLRELR